MPTNPKSQITLLVASTFLAAFSLASIVNFTDPLTASWITFTCFYFSLFITVLGTFTILGLLFRQWLWPGRYVINLNNGFRQALLVAILVTVSFLLLSHRLLFWWMEASLILFLIFVEAFLTLKV